MSVADYYACVSFTREILMVDHTGLVRWENLTGPICSPNNAVVEPSTRIVLRIPENRNALSSVAGRVAGPKRSANTQTGKRLEVGFISTARTNSFPESLQPDLLLVTSRLAIRKNACGHCSFLMILRDAQAVRLRILSSRQHTTGRVRESSCRGQMNLLNPGLEGDCEGTCLCIVAGSRGIILEGRTRCRQMFLNRFTNP